MGLFRPDPDTDLQRLRHQGMTYAAISRETGIPMGSIYRRLNPHPVLTCDECGARCGELRRGLAPAVMVCRTCEWKGK
jgi:RNA polymerase-binding transcription factor DksA